QAIAYILAALPAFEYLHGQGLVYCDFKPDNLIQVGDSVKLIDLGGVRRLGDHDADIYGTIGFQAPEVPTLGTTVASDLYTIGRTLAVLTMDFRGYTSAYVDSLPDPADHPALRDHEPFYRFLHKACAPHPDDRFQSATAMSEQLLGVLRIIVAAQTGAPQPGPSHEFTGAPVGKQLLPWLAVDPSDDAAAFLARMSDDPVEALAQLDQAVRDGQVMQTVEVRLRAASDLVEAGPAAPPEAITRWTGPLDQTRALIDEDPWNWRAVWVQGYARLAAGDLAGAATDFDRVRSEAPGELAPLYASAVVAERTGNRALAEALYDLVSTVDPSWVTASMGLGRVRADAGDVDGAIGAYGRVPVTHRAHAAAQRELVVVLTAAGRYGDAMQQLDAAPSGDDRDRLRASLLEAAIADLAAGRLPEDPAAAVGDVPQTERDLRSAAEAAYRRLARSADDPAVRHALVDRANQIRPVTVL
ncbi:MAG TPA: tetratricopeptide repeat protein, partial [Nitriliruptorales bacterium]